MESETSLVEVPDAGPPAAAELPPDEPGPVIGHAAQRRWHRLPGAVVALAGSRWAPPITLVGFSLVLSWFVWPGHLDADALKQIQQAQTGHFNNWWAPIFDWMMRGVFLLGGGPGIVVAATILVVLVALYQLLRVRLSRWWAALSSMLVAIFPPVLGYLTSLQRDVWFGATALLSYALLVRATGSPVRARRVFAVLSLVSAWFAMAARQNAVPALIPGVVVGIVMLLRPRAAAPEARRGRSGARPVLIAILTVLLFGAFYLSQDVLTYDVIGAVRAYPQQELFEQDLAGISIREGVDLLPRAIFPAHNLAVLRRYYSPATVIPLVEGAGHPLITYANASGYHQLEHAWEHAIEHHPVGYFHARWNLWMAEIDWNVNAWAPFHPGIDKNTLGLHEAFPVLDNFVLRYLGAFGTIKYRGGVVTKAWVYLLISPFLGLSLIRRRRSFPVRIVGFMVLGAFVYTLTFAVAAMADTFRWNWYLVTVTATGLVIQAAETFEAAVEKRVQRRTGAALSADPGSAVPHATGVTAP